MKFKSESSIKRVHAALVKELDRSGEDTFYGIRIKDALDTLDWVTSKKVDGITIIHLTLRNDRLFKKEQKEWTSKPQP